MLCMQMLLSDAHDARFDICVRSGRGIGPWVQVAREWQSLTVREFSRRNADLLDAVGVLRLGVVIPVEEDDESLSAPLKPRQGLHP
jgi:hypothetical protein